MKLSTSGIEFSEGNRNQMAGRAKEIGMTPRDFMQAYVDRLETDFSRNRHHCRVARQRRSSLDLVC